MMTKHSNVSGYNAFLVLGLKYTIPVLSRLVTSVVDLIRHLVQGNIRIDHPYFAFEEWKGTDENISQVAHYRLRTSISVLYQ